MIFLKKLLWLYDQSCFCYNLKSFILLLSFLKFIHAKYPQIKIMCTLVDFFILPDFDFRTRVFSNSDLS